MLYHFAVDSLPAELKNPFMSRYQVAACCAAVPVAMIVKGLYSRPGAFLPINQPGPFFCFFPVEAEGGLNVKACSREEVSGEDFHGHPVCDHFLYKPRPALYQAPVPEIFMELYFPRPMKVRRGEGLHEGIGFRDNVVGQLVVHNVPGGAGSPGGKFIIPGAAGSFKVVVSKPCNPF